MKVNSQPAGRKWLESRSDIENPGTYADEALADAKKAGLKFAVYARLIALAIIAVMIAIINPNLEVLYFHFVLCLFALIGWAQLKVGTVGLSRAELGLLFCDLALMTIVSVVPNPFSLDVWPVAMQYRFGTFLFFFVLLASGTLSYSWRTILAIGTWTAGLWTTGLVWSYYFTDAQPQLTIGTSDAFGVGSRLALVMDPNSFNFGLRLQEIVVFVIVACILALTVKRSGDLLRRHAAAERERSNLARYFSPKIAEELSHNDEPLKQVRTQNVTVMFVDIVGFTAYASENSPDEVIKTLRAFHARMERQVFQHDGTLDKYLGDGLMATFGTPFVGKNDALNALRCARSMLNEIKLLNKEWKASGKPTIRVGVGLHYGSVVLADIGSNRLEFAVIGNTVNIASRIENLTRKLNCSLAMSDALVSEVKLNPDTKSDEFQNIRKHSKQAIRGLVDKIPIWVQDRPI